MAALTAEAIGRLLVPFEVAPDADLLERLRVYLELLLRWNAKTNLTAIRDPSAIVSRHFGESLFVARHVPETGTLLDFGSGAGFPGLPIALAHPRLAVTLAESQNKKASFLREAVRVLGLSTQVWPARVESMPLGLRFDCVTLRAVDKMIPSMVSAGHRAASMVLVLTTEGFGQQATQLEGFVRKAPIPVPSANNSVLSVFQRR